MQRRFINDRDLLTQRVELRSCNVTLSWAFFCLYTGPSPLTKTDRPPLWSYYCFRYRYNRQSLNCPRSSKGFGRKSRKIRGFFRRRKEWRTGLKSTTRESWLGSTLPSACGSCLPRTISVHKFRSQQKTSSEQCSTPSPSLLVLGNTKSCITTQLRVFDYLTLRLAAEDDLVRWLC